MIAIFSKHGMPAIGTMLFTAWVPFLMQNSFITMYTYTIAAIVTFFFHFILFC